MGDQKLCLAAKSALMVRMKQLAGAQPWPLPRTKRAEVTSSGSSGINSMPSAFVWRPKVQPRFWLSLRPLRKAREVV